MTYRLQDFDYDLPAALVAQEPMPVRSGSRLLHVDGDKLADLRFIDLLERVDGNDVLVFNDTRVIKARIHAQKVTGGRVELLVERLRGDDEALVQLRASHPPSVGAVLHLAEGATARVLARDQRWYRLKFLGTGPLVNWLERQGEMPLPPYIHPMPGRADEERYQTVYARAAGAVAAPTAGLHFDHAMLKALSDRGVDCAFLTLHVGAGTFQPVQADGLGEHRMHPEWYSIPAATVAAVDAARARGGRVMAVGTTSLRALEAAAESTGRLAPGSGETSLFITPGYRFRVVDRLLTNFHLPKSTLLMLVSAFGGYDNLRAAYAHAIAQRYRFFSYGDAMLIERWPGADSG